MSISTDVKLNKYRTVLRKIEMKSVLFNLKSLSNVTFHFYPNINESVKLLLHSTKTKICKIKLF